MNLSEIRTLIQANWPDNYYSSYLTDDKTDEFINKVKDWVCQGTIMLPSGKLINHNFSWMKRETTTSTVDQQRRYALPDGTGSIWKFKSEITCELIDSNSVRKELNRRLKRDIEHDPKYANTTDKGVPDCYCIDDFDLWLYHLPDHNSNSGSAWTVNLEYYGIILDMSDDTDTNKITDDYPYVLVYGGTEMGFRYGKNFEEAAYWEQKKIEKFIEMLKADQMLEYANLEEGMQPVAGSGIGEANPGYTGNYSNPTPYS